VISRKALYQQVWDVLAERITSGVWKPGAVIPNESDLARELGVSVGTMRKALALLEERRLVTRRQRRGTYVNDQAAHALAERFSNLRTGDGTPICAPAAPAQISQGSANELERARLRLRADEPVYRIRRLRHRGQRVFLIEDATVPAALFAGLADMTPIADHIGALAQHYGILLGKVEERIFMRPPPAAIAEALGLVPDTTVMVLDRVVLALDSFRPVEWRLAHCHPDGAYYHAQMR
jgi:GntR family transcriptional regulator